MVNANWDTSLKFVLQFEGGYDTNPKDRGNWTSGKIGVGELKGTKYGVAAFVYPDLDIKNLTVEDASKIYNRDYWPKIAGTYQPSGVDLFMFDTCVNNGAGRALEFQRKALDTTLKTANSLAQKAIEVPDKVAQIKKLAALRGSFYQSLSTFSTFGKGWMRRNAAAEAKATSLAMQADKVRPDIAKQQIGKKSDEAKADQKSAVTKAGGSGTAGAATTQEPSQWNWDWWTLGKIGLILILVALVIYFIHKAMVNNERSKAFLEEAKSC